MLWACLTAAGLCAVAGFFNWPGFQAGEWTRAVSFGVLGGLSTYLALRVMITEEGWLCAPSYLCRCCPMCGEELMDAARTKVHRSSGLTVNECARREFAILAKAAEATIEKSGRDSHSK